MNLPEINHESLKDFLITSIEAQSVIAPLSKMIRERTSKAGRRHEEVFTREFLCPAIGEFFYKVVFAKLGLSKQAIQSGLGTEGYHNCQGFGFTPARKGIFLFTKTDIIHNAPPKSWLKINEDPLPPFQACPDFAIKEPLPLSIVGEVTYFKSGSPDAAVKELFNAAKQATFYLSVFREVYHSAMVVVADATAEYSFFRGLDAIKPELLERFSADTGIFLVPIKLR